MNVTVTAVGLHYATVRGLGWEVKRLSAGVAPSPLISAYDAVARPLGHLLHEREELIFDRVQTLDAQQKLVPGAMAKSAQTWNSLNDEWRSQSSLLECLFTELSSAPQNELTDAIARFANAARDCAQFEAITVTEALTPFITA